MSGSICIECLRCRHRGVLEQGQLPNFGEAPDAPLAVLVRRLRCVACGSGSVKAFRSSHDDAHQFLRAG
jgi:hypothetical protein